MMIKSIPLLAVVGLFLITSCQPVHSDEDVLKLSERKFRWMIDKQLDSLERHLDENLIFIHSNGWVQTKKDMIQDIQSGKLHLLDVKSQDHQVRIYDQTALVTAKGTFTSLSEDGTESSVVLLYTEVYVYKGSLWLLASRHSNKIAM